MLRKSLSSLSNQALARPQWAAARSRSTPLALALPSRLPPFLRPGPILLTSLQSMSLFHNSALQWKASSNPSTSHASLFERNIRSSSSQGSPSPAIVSEGKSHSYSQLLSDALNFSKILSEGRSLEGRRVAFLCPNNYSYVVTQWAVWLAGGVTVPLCITHPRAELEYTITDSDSAIVVASSPNFVTMAGDIARDLKLRFISLDSVRFEKESIAANLTVPQIPPDSDAMIIYTSGTTGKPKGVVTTHANIEAMASTLTSAWKYSQADRVLQILPLHHVHGVINALTCGLWAGATVEMMAFDSGKVWAKLLQDRDFPTVFTAVPTVYSKLIEAYAKFDEQKKREVKQKLSRVRLMMSGSAALPEPIFHQWETISGHRLLERYGMTEIGMALGNPYEPMSARTPGSVGTPFPGTAVRLKSLPEDEAKRGSDEGSMGELLIKSGQVFKEYYKRPEETKKSFDEDGFFITGDIVQVTPSGVYKILGRSSVDIIKSGGYKISALEIEREILSFAGVTEVAVIGVADETWGQTIVAIVSRVLTNWKEEALVAFLKARLAGYKVPRKFVYVDTIPRNAMGKVNKKELLKWYLSQ